MVACERVLSPHMLRVLCLLFVLSNSAIAFTPAPPRLIRPQPHLAPTWKTARMRPRIEGGRTRRVTSHPRMTPSYLYLNKGTRVLL